MNLLHERGYKTISAEMLVRAIKEGAELPRKSIILTFDDGSESVYTTAFPVMQEYDFTGTVYIIYKYMGTPAYMNVEQISELYDWGWEVGSHGLNHVDLTQRTDRQEHEIVSSRSRLQADLDVPILTFAYPFGAYDEDCLRYAHEAGYIAAVGLGASMIQGEENLFYLYRRDVKGSYDLRIFSSFLPWP